MNVSTHEKWFENSYLKTLGLRNRKIKADDFEGIICDSNNNDLAIFELKLITFPNKQEEVSKEFKLTDFSKGLIPFPQADKIRNNLRNSMSEARCQVLEKEKMLILPRIIFLMINTPDIHTYIGVSIVSAIKGKRITVFPDGVSMFESEISQNKEATDLFYDDNLSGIICIYTGIVEHRGVFVLKNIKAKNQIP